MDKSFKKSEALFTEAQKLIPGGVNSPVRAFKSVGGTPLFFERAKGAHMWDADGNKYIDYVGSWGPMILGHCNEMVKAAQHAAVDKATSFGAPSEIENNVASLLLDMVPGIDRIRMVNSGTEACMSAARLARGYTGRDKIIKFEGCYHGHGDSFLIKAGSGALTLGSPSSPGVTTGTAQDTLLATFNNLESVSELINNNKGEIAAIILEPVAGNMGCIPPADGFLIGLRKLCDDNKIVLIFDEVMCGFRIAPGGAQQLYSVQADIVTYGKIIGGGMPVGAFGGKVDIMDYLSPVGDVYQAGTLSGNPLAMHTGYATLSQLHKQPDIYPLLERQSDKLEAGLQQILDKLSIPYQLNRVGSMMSLHFSEQPVVDFDSACAANVKLFNAYYHNMLQRGVYLAPSAYESFFVSTCHDDDVLGQTLDAAEASREEALKVA